MNNINKINIISLKTAAKKVLMREGNLSISIYEPSIIEVHCSPQDVSRYLRQGKDLLIYMKDGSVIRCHNYYVDDPDSQGKSELVFNDQEELTHITFADTGEMANFAATEQAAQLTPIASLEPFFERSSSSHADTPWGWMAGAALGGGAIGALLSRNSSGETETTTKVIDNTTVVESATPVFIVTDKAGDKQGRLSTKEITDDNTPTFSGSGQPGATIQIKENDGSTIASTLVGADGSWIVKLPTQTDGTHSWSVVQIEGSKTVSAGSITLTVSTDDASITLAATTGNNVINASERMEGFTLSGTSENLADGAVLTVKLNGKIYTAQVDTNGAWSVKIPAADAQALEDGIWTVDVSGQDAAGNRITHSQTLEIDTQAPTLTVDPFALDNIINANEHGQSLILSGTSSAEAGQTVTLTLNGKNYSATLHGDGKWSLTLSASDVKGLANGDHALTVSVSDKAGNSTSTMTSFSVDTMAPVVAINTVSGDDVINTSELGQAQIISGQAKGATAGDLVLINLGGHNYTTVVLADGSWNIGVQAPDVLGLGEGSHTITVSITDTAGNTGSTTHKFTINSNSPELTVDAISQDNVLNAGDVVQPLSLSGTSNLPDGSAVTVTLNGVNYQTIVGQGVWSVLVPVTDLLNLENTLYTVSVSGSNSVGNIGSANASLLVDSALPQVIINTFAGDNRVNNAEAAEDQTLSGRVTGAAEGDIVFITLGSKTYTATLSHNLSWSVTIPSTELTAFGDGDLTFSASVTNARGNTGTGERSISINAGLPGLRVNTVSGDDVINAIEQQQNLIVNGSSTSLEKGTQVTVIINGIEYATVVMANGSWQLGIPAADLQAWTAGDVILSVSSENSWGHTVSTEHTIKLDLNDVAVTIDIISSDNMLNATEKGADVIVSGQTQGVEAGQSVIVKFADQYFTAQVQEDGSWNLVVPASAIEGLTDGRAQLSVSVTNVNGNSAHAGRTITVDTLAPTLFIDNLTDDNIINAAEAHQDLLLSGTSNAEAGQTVTVTLNGKQYQTAVQNDGIWQLSIPAADMSALENGTITVTANVSDTAGNSGSAVRVGHVDATVPKVTINNFVTDTNTVNLAAHSQAQILSGQVTGAAAGDLVTITIKDIDYITVVDAAGHWLLGIPASVVQSLADGTWTIDVSVTDVSGNTGSSALEVVVNTAIPQIAINTLAMDDVINATEKNEGLLLSGTTNQPEGTTVTVSLNSIDYTATTSADGSWSVSVPASAFSELEEAKYSLAASVTDSVGNSGSALHDILVDNTLPVVTIDIVAGDNVVNAAEVAAGQLLTGKVSNAVAGNTVTITLGGNLFTTTVQDDLSWSLNLPAEVLSALGNGALTVTASVTNSSGNTGTGERDITIDANLPGLRVNTVAGDDVINYIEHTQNLIVSGSSHGMAAGTALTLTVNDKIYAATVLADGSWSAAIPAADVSAFVTGTVSVTVQGQSMAGNPISISHDVIVDLAEVAISINAISTDDVINAAEKGQDLVLSGTTANVEESQTVTVIMGGRAYSAWVNAEGNWTTVIPSAHLMNLKEGDASVQVNVTNVNGNSASAGREYRVDAKATSVTIDTIAENNVINGSEAAAGITISGTTTAEVGQTVTVTFGGNSYIALVQEGGLWSASIPAASLTAMIDADYSVQVSVNDAAGNPGSASKTITLDARPPAISFNAVAGDNVINSVEQAKALIVSGTTTGANVGDKLVITIGSNQYITTVDGTGHWSVGIPASVLSELPDGITTIIATITDSAGNSSTQTHDVAVNTASVMLTIETISNDDVINAAEAGNALVINGSSAQFASGTQVIITLNGQNYTATIQDDGRWTTTVPAADVGGLADGNSYGVFVSAQDRAGNSATASHSISMDLSAPAISISTVADDDLLNAAELQLPLTINGTSSAEAGQIVTVTLGNQTYTATVASDSTWSLVVPATDLAALSDGSLMVTASVHDQAGNVGQIAHSLTIDTVAPSITINTVAGDDTVNHIEQLAGQTISGTTKAEPGQTITVSFAGYRYQATVGADGAWSVFVPGQDFIGLIDGEYEITAVVADRAGNMGQSTHSLTVNTVAPVVTINTVAGDDIVNNTEQQAGQILSGTTTAEPGQTVTVSFNGHRYQATAGADGTWSVFVPARDFLGLADGEYTITATVNDTANNQGNATHEVILNGKVPTITINTVAQDDIVNAYESNTSLVISGATDVSAGQTVILTLNGKTYTTTVQSDGNWSYTLGSADVAALADGGAYVINALINNSIGNSASTERTFNVDLTPPSMGIVIDSLLNDTGLSASDFITSDARVVLNGSLTAQPGNNEKAQISLDGGATWIDLTVSGTHWRYTEGRTLMDGTYQYQVRVIDSAGNVGATHRQDVVIDRSAPTVKSITVDAVTQDTGLSNSDFITSDNQISLKGTLDATLGSGEYAQISIDGGMTWSSVSVSGITWTYVDGRTLADGDYNYQLRVIDNAGNISATASQLVTIDTTAPDASKSITIDSISDDTGLSNSDFITHDTSLTVNGSLGAALAHDEYAQISIDGGMTWQNVNVMGNRWFYVDERTLDNANYTYVVRVVDAAGNVGASAQQQVIVDTVAPDAASGVTVDRIDTDTGHDDNDFLTSSTSYTLNGTLGASLGSNEFLQVSMDGGKTWVYATVNGTQWSYNDTRILADGSHNYQVRVIDQAGNVGATTSQVVIVDTLAPTETITIDSLIDSEGIYQGRFPSGTYTDDTSPVLTGTLSGELDSSSSVRIYQGSTLLGTATVSGTSWTFSGFNELADGSYTFTAVIVDLAGNEGTASSQFTFTVDTVAPAATATIISFTDNVGANIDEYGSGSATDDIHPRLNGTLSHEISPTDSVRIYQNGVFIGNAVVTGNTWTFDVIDALKDATTYTYNAVVSDAAGNQANASPDFTLSVDISAPTQFASIDSYFDNVNELTGDFASGTHTNDSSPLLQGTLNAPLGSDEVLRIYQGTTLIGNAITAIDGEGNITWTMQLPTLIDDRYTFTAVVVDSVGNMGVVSNEFILTVDTLPPTTGSVTVDRIFTADTTPVITGTVTGIEDGNTLWVTVNGVRYIYGIDSELTINGNSWSLAISDDNELIVKSPVDIHYHVDARLTDLAGNYLQGDNELTVYRDTAVIRSPGFDYMAETQPAFIIRGEAGAGETLLVEIFDAYGVLVKTFTSTDGTMTQIDTGNWTIASEAWGATHLESGHYTISSRVVVADGRGGQESVVESFTIIEPEIAQSVTNSTDDSASRVYATEDGGYWLFWATATAVSSVTYNLYAQRYDQNGSIVGDKVTIATSTGQTNTYNLQYIYLYDVYMKNDGSFSVFYSQNNAHMPSLQNYDSNGNAVGDVVPINSSLIYELTPKYVAMENGGYALVYNSGTVSNYNVYAIRFDSHGNALDGTPQALTSGVNLNNGFAYNLGLYVGQPVGLGADLAVTTQGMSAVDVGDNKYAVLYMSSKSGTHGTDMYMKVIDFSTGKEISGSEIIANSLTDKMQIGANLIALKGGGFVATWVSNTGSAGNFGTMDGFDVYSRRFTWDINSQKLVALDNSEVRVNTTTTGVNGVAFNSMSVNMSAASLEQGGYVIVWSKFTAANKSNVYAQSFDAAGNKIGGETLISTENINVNSSPSVTALKDGGYVVSWDHMTTAINYNGGYTNDIQTVIVNADGTIRGTGDQSYYSPSASYLDATSGTITGDEAVNTLDGRHGAMVLNAGEGNDYIIINSTQFTAVDGGAGFDTLIWDSADNLDFSTVRDKVSNIEAIHLGDNFANTLTLTLEDVLAASGTTDVLVVQGGSTDIVSLTDSGWLSIGKQIWRGESYQVYENQYDTHASLWVQNGITVAHSAVNFAMSEKLNRSSISGSDSNDTLVMEQLYETLNIGNGGQDTLLFKLLNSADATGGNGHSVVNGFTVGNYNTTLDSDRIDLRDLLSGTGLVSDLIDEATPGGNMGNIADYIRVVQKGSHTEIQIDRDGSGTQFDPKTVVTLNGVQTDLATLLANHQILIS